VHYCTGIFNGLKSYFIGLKLLFQNAIKKVYDKKILIGIKDIMAFKLLIN